MIGKIGKKFCEGLIFILLLLSLTGCSRTDGNEEVTLGVAWPFESDQSLFEEGIDLAVEQINKEGGIKGQSLKLFKLDDASEVTAGMAAAERMTEESSVRAVIGHENSYISIPASAIYEEAEMVMLSPASTAPELTMNGQKTTFRIIPSDTVIAKKAAEYLAAHDCEEIVLYYTEDSYGKGLADAFEDQAKQNNITVVDRFSDYMDIKDLTRMQRKWEAFGYDGFFIATYVQEGSSFISDCVEGGLDGIFMGGNALDNAGAMDAARLGKENIVIGSVFNPEGSESAESFVYEFTKRYGQAPDIYSALGYDAVRILADALNNTKNCQRNEIAGELIKLGTWKGVCGNHVFAENGDDVGDLVTMKQLVDGTFISLETGKK